MRNISAILNHIFFVIREILKRDYFRARKKHFCLGSSVPFLRLAAFGESMKSAKYEIIPTRFTMCAFTLKNFKNALEVKNENSLLIWAYNT